MRDVKHFSVIPPAQPRAWYTTGGDFQTALAGALEPNDERIRNSAPYAIQFGTERVINVQYESREALLQSTFLYAYQQSTAQALISIPIERYGEIARQAWHAGAKELRPALLFSVGRTGSTLLSKLFAALAIPSLSEPDVFTHYALLKMQAGTLPGTQHVPQVQGDIMASLLHAAGSERAAIKFRSQVNAIAAELMGALPGATGFMLLREPGAWAESLHRAFGWQPGEIADSLALAFRALDACRRADRPLTILRYEDMTARPLEFLASVARYCGYESRAIDQDQVSRIVGTDSQQGSVIAQQALAKKTIPASFRSEFRTNWESECQALDNEGIDVPVEFR